MAIFQKAVRTANGTIAQAALEIQTPVASLIKRITITLSSAVAPTVFGLGRPSSFGTMTTPTNFPATRPARTGAGASQALSATAWSVNPGAPGTFLERMTFAGTVGERQVLDNLNLLVFAGGGFLLWNITTNAVADVTIVLEE